MKKVIFIFTMLAAVWTGTFFTSCDSPSQNAADAKANVQDAKQDLKTAQQESAAAELKAASA